MDGKRFIGKSLAVAAMLVVAFGPGFAAKKHPPLTSPASAVDDRGVFQVSFGGHSLGTEKFQIQSGAGGIVATAEIHLKFDQGVQPLVLDTRPQLVLNSLFEPKTYSVAESGSRPYHLGVNFRVSPAKSLLRLANSKEDDERDFGLAKDVVVLDDNVIHHYQILVDRFAAKPDAKQSFTAYIPQEALPGVLTVQKSGMEEVNVAGEKENLQHLTVSTDNAQIELWVDGHERLQRVLSPALQLEAVRTK